MPRPRIYRNNAEKQAAYRQRKKRRFGALFSSNKEDWETPDALFAELNAVFHFDTDVCALPESAKCDHFFTPYENGLLQEWKGVCWMNPPYGKQVIQWVKKAAESADAGATVVCLLPARTDTIWWHDYVAERADEVRFLRGRLKFGKGENSAPFPSVIVIFRPRQETDDNVSPPPLFYDRALLPERPS